MKLDLEQRPGLLRLANSNSLRFQDELVEARSGNPRPLLSHVMERGGDAVSLVVDHSYFSAKRTRFEFSGRRGDMTAATILEAVQEAVIEVQARTLAMLTSVNATTINSLDANEIVHNVLREVMNVLPHSDAGVFRLFEEESGFLIPVSHEGLEEEYTHYRLQPNESVSGDVFVTGIPAIHNGRQNIIDAHRVMRPESQSFMERSQIANALLCVPVMAEGKRLGTLTTLCFSNDGAFSVFDQTILETLANQIAVAYQRSLAYKNAVAASQRLETMRNDLALKNSELDRALQLHNKLLSIFSSSDSLTGQLHSVSILFEVEFRFESVLGINYHSAAWCEYDEPLRQTVEVAEVPIGHLYFNAIGDGSFHRALFGTLAAFIALDFVRDMSRMDLLNARKKAFFEALSSGSETDRRQDRYGYKADRFNQILTAIVPGVGAGDEARLSLHKTLSSLQREALLQNGLMFHDGERIVMLFSASVPAVLERNLRAISAVAGRLAIYVGASDAYDKASSHSLAADQALQAAEGLARQGRTGLLRCRDMGLELLLAGRDRRDVLGFVRQVLHPLLEDEKHRVLLETIVCYVQEGKSVLRTAAAMKIHQNTLYQRLARIEALTDRSVSDAADYTLLSLACQLHKAYRPA